MVNGKVGVAFYTPSDVSNLIAQLMEPIEGDEICDPACGSGSLLVACGALINKRSGEPTYRLYGQEANRSHWAIAKMNMFIHSEYEHRIEWGDSLRDPKLLNEDEKRLKQFDIVISNPPFSLTHWGFGDLMYDKFHRFHRGMPPKSKGDYAFISHMIKTLKPETGRMGVIMPHGVLFRGKHEGDIRQHLIEENLLDAVIGLPEKLFYTTTIPVVLLLFKTAKTDNNVLFIDASKGFTSGKNQNQLQPMDIDKIVDAYKHRKSIERYAYLASFEEIAANDFNLNIPRYIDTFDEEVKVDLALLHKERVSLQSELQTLEQEMGNFLNAMGIKSP
jgi:type I restriction enzyme M protein